jgi:hypothetical protein
MNFATHLDGVTHLDDSLLTSQASGLPIMVFQVEHF